MPGVGAPANGGEDKSFWEGDTVEDPGVGGAAIGGEGESFWEGDTVDVDFPEAEGVGQAEGFTESPVVAQAAGQVQGVGAPDPEGQ